ncbi:MAG: 3-hydroxyacyl-CoA dehydrogenase NAD-binding domain-containing protein [Sphingobium sp.]
MEINAVTDYVVEHGVAVITTNSPPVNALSHAVRAGLAEGMEKAIADPAVQAVVIRCEGRTFYAGADITEFGSGPKAPLLQDVQQVVENAPKPVVAAIHGTALGGGLELALVAHYRVAVPSAKAGLPEVNIGLVPGAGGTQRLPRIVGVEAALDLVTSGRHVPARQAHDMGLFDELVEEGKLREGAIAFARKIVEEGRPLKKVRDSNEKVEAARGKPEIFEAFRKANAKKFRGFLAPEYNIRCIEAAVNLPIEEGLVEERRLITELFAGTQSPAQRHVFFAERQAAKVPGIGADTPARAVDRVGVIGAGTMGGGIAMSLVNAGIPVTLVETTQAALDRGLATIRKNYDTTVSKGKLKAGQVEERMGLLTPSLDMGDLAGVDLVIEAAFEQIDVKRDIFERLDKIARPGAILATNTSYLDLDEIAAFTGRPQDVVGLHFFSPANVMRLLEVVRGDKTAPDVLATAMGLAKRIGKLGVVVGNCFGFVGNRILSIRDREVNKLLLEGATPTAIDKVLYDFGFPMGHLQMRDLVGLDVGWNREKSSSATVREILNEMGRHGQKSGGGYYDYDEKRNATPSPVAAEVIEAFAAKQGIARRAVSDEEIRDRILYAMVNEGAKILEEGKAIRASDIDVIWVTGYGWPVYRGGPMHWAGIEGLPKVVERLKAMEAVHGPDFTPAPLLVRLAAEGKSFADA